MRLFVPFSLKAPRHDPSPHYDSPMAIVAEPCPVEEAIRVVGGKWKLLVLRSMLLNGPQRYNEMLNTVAGISPKELTRNLRELADAGLVVKGSGSGRTTSYGLTKLGKGLMPTFKKLLTWGQALLKSKA